MRDTRYEWAYIFGAVCPERATGAALVLPFADTQAMNLHLAEIARTVAPGAHAVLVLDGAGWHGGKDLAVPDNISLLTLPPYAPELNPVENVWEYLRGNRLEHETARHHHPHRKPGPDGQRRRHGELASDDLVTGAGKLHEWRFQALPRTRPKAGRGIASPSERRDYCRGRN